jgi:hypothetical protein
MELETRLETLCECAAVNASSDEVTAFDDTGAEIEKNRQCISASSIFA